MTFNKGSGGSGGGVSGGTTTKLAAPTNSINFASIPSTVQHLLFIGDLGTNRAGQAGGFVFIQFNGDGAAHYYSEFITNQNAVVTAANSSGDSGGRIDTTGALGPANELLTPFMLWVPNIQGQSSNKKFFLFEGNDATPPTTTAANWRQGWWQPTVLATSITSVKFDANAAGSGQLITGSVISMYQFS